MFRNYFKTAWRNLFKNRFYSLLNIIGLCLGLTVGILILLWVQDEYSFDRFHKKTERIYRLENMVGTGSSRQLWTFTAAPIGILAKNEIPGIEDATRMSYNGYYGLFKYEDKIFNEQNTYFVDGSFFKIFDFDLVEGNPNHPFPDENSIILTEEMAKKYFGNQEAVGKIITADDKTPLKVSGVVRNFPRNSSIRVDMLFSMDLLATKMYEGNTDGRNLENDFHQFNYITFLQLKPGLNLKQVPEKLRNIHLRIKPDDTDIGYLLQPLKEMHLYRGDGSDAGIGTVRMFTIISILILVIACINYVNLSTARSMLRAKEVSLRKIVGAARLQLIFQFVLETAILFVLAVSLSLILVYLLVPAFNEISGKQLVVQFRDLNIWKVIALTFMGTLVISSIYPALLLSSFNPVNALKGRISTHLNNVFFRKVLVIIQFSFSVILIAGTLIIGIQMKYIRSRQLGYNMEFVLSAKLINMKDHYEAIKADLLSKAGVENVTASSVNIISYMGHTGSASWDGKEEGETLMLSPMAVDRNFISFFKMNLIEGDGFSGTSADSTHFILNETAVKAARLTNPIGKKFKIWDTEGTIVGVVKDFHFNSMRQKIEPAIFYFKPQNLWMLYIKTNGEQAPRAIAALEENWKKYNDGFSYSYSFLDNTINELYSGEERTASLYNIFSLIAILISCLGLLGLVAYTSQVRKKEIGIRKVLGAPVASIIRMLSSDFIKLVGIAVVIAVPIAWYMMDKWLMEFAYRVEIPWWIFLLSGLIAVMIAMLTISFQSIRSALANPVKTIRNDQ